MASTHIAHSSAYLDLIQLNKRSMPSVAGNGELQSRENGFSRKYELAPGLFQGLDHLCFDQDERACRRSHADRTHLESRDAASD